MRWDCGECISYQRNVDRNCNNQFPNSQVGTKGYDLVGVKVYECPKTYVKQQSIEMIKLIDSMKILNVSSMDPNRISARYAEAVLLIEDERNKVHISKDALKKVQGEVAWQDLQKK